MKRAFLCAALCATMALPLSVAHAAQSDATATAKPTDEDIARLVHESMAEMDRNHDGRITRLELTSYGVSHHWGVAVRSKRWKRMDTNRNGVITEDEFRADATKYFASR